MKDNELMPGIFAIDLALWAESQLLSAGVKDFEGWVVEDKIYYFGKLKDLK